MKIYSSQLNKTTPQRQEGAVLLIGLVTILILTVIGLYASRASTMGIMMATNSQHIALALAAAENSVAAGEKRIVTTFGGAPTYDLNDVQSDGMYYIGDVDMDTVDWEAPSGIERDFDINGNLVAEYIIEYIGVAAGGGSVGSGTGGATASSYLYRISGRGQSARGGSRIVQTIFASTD